MICAREAFPQDHQWWADNVQWDGKSHWSTYIISMPKYLGPNALPIPELSWGKVAERSSVGWELQGHFMEGDRTGNAILRGVYSITPGKIALEAFWLPVEYAVVSHENKTARKVFHRFYERRWASGDVYVQTTLQLLKGAEGEGFMFRLGHRLPASNMQGAARFTDAPGFYGDLSKSVELGGHWRLAAMAGLYVWQTNRDDQFQNDAFLFGAGVSRGFGPLQVDLSFRGYLGYMGRGDDPLAAAVRFCFKGKSWNGQITVQQGFLDLQYSTLGFGICRMF
jgi:hypothetical protein